MERSTSGSVKFVWMSLDRPTRSLSFKHIVQTDRTSEDRLRDKRNVTLIFTYDELNK